jgi:hypothetical protein
VLIPILGLPGGYLRGHPPEPPSLRVSCRLACRLLSFIIVVVAPNCSVGVVMGVVDDVGDADDAGGVGV